MDGLFVNKMTVDRDRYKISFKTPIHFLYYTGNDLYVRDMRKFIEVIYRNFQKLVDRPELKHSHKEIARIITSSKSIIIIGVVNNCIVAYLIAEMTATENLRQLMHIYYIYTSPNYRNKGIATHMLNLIQKYANELNVTMMSLTYDTNDKKLEAFYLKNHFIYDSNLRSYQRYEMLVKYV